MALGVRVRGLARGFAQEGGRLPVLAGLDLDVPPGSFVSLLGPSGAGKSTLLNILAGLDTPDAGEVTLYSDTGPLAGPRLGHVGYMPQRDLLLPWRTALDNAIVGLEIQGVARDAARRRARDLFQAFGLAEFAGHYPPALSGGMRQRVSFARSALPAQGLLLLDEPFGALDSLTRTAMQEWVLGVWAGLGLTILMVTHDLDEAVLLSTRVYALTPRPARIAAVVEVALPARRTLDSLTDPAFQATKARLLAALRASGSLPATPPGGAAA